MYIVMGIIYLGTKHRIDLECLLYTRGYMYRGDIIKKNLKRKKRVELEKNKGAT